MKLLLSALFGLAVACSAQMKVSQPVYAPGVQILIASDPGFDNELKLILDGLTTQGFEALLPYSVIVKNDGPGSYATLSVQYLVGDTASGHGSIRNMHFEGWTRPVLPAHGRFLVTPENRVTFPIAAHRPPMTTGVGQLLNLFNPANQVTTSLDSLIYSDGRIIGPDKSDVLNLYNAMTRAEDDFAKNLRTRVDRRDADETVLDWATTYTQQTAEDDYHRHLASMADQFVEEARRFGYSKAVDRAQSYAARSNKKPHIHR